MVRQRFARAVFALGLLFPLSVATTAGATTGRVAGRPAGAARATQEAPSGFSAGAASVDITPPRWTVQSDNAFVPACGASPAAVSQAWPGPRLFAFEEPYLDLAHLGHYVIGDPYCDADHTGRYQAPYLGGGVGTGRWPTSVQAGNPLTAQAVVMNNHGERVALAVVDSIGLFNSTMDQIRAQVHTLAPQVDQVFVASTHDESAPDPIGLWGPGGATPVGTVNTPLAVSSGVDEFYMAFLVRRVAEAIAAANGRLQSADLRVTYAQLPANLQSCWVSYPYIDDQMLPVMQLLASRTGRVIATVVNANTHVVTLAFSGVASLTDVISADWPGIMRADLQAHYPGSVGVELSGLVGAIGDPTLYLPATTQVVNVPGPVHSPPGNPVKCLASVYPDPPHATPLSQPLPYMRAYGRELATAAITAIQHSAAPVTPSTLAGQHMSLCIQLENNLFAAAFTAGLFPDRPAYVDPTCSIGAAFDRTPAPSYGLTPGPVWGANPLWLKTDVGVLTVGPAQFAFTPGEVFPFTEIRGHLDPAQMPFPTTCYDPATGSYTCGPSLPMTAWVTARMTAPYRFMAGLGEDMIGYLFPPGDFVGSPGATTEQPWAGYELTQPSGNDRFGYAHFDDTESVGPHAGLEVTDALSQLLAQDGPGDQVLAGSYVDARGRTSDSPFASDGFAGAVGVVVRTPGGSSQTFVVGCNARGWVTFNGSPDPGTAGTPLAYSVSTAGVLLTSGRPLLVDVFAGSTLHLTTRGLPTARGSCPATPLSGRQPTSAHQLVRAGAAAGAHGGLAFTGLETTPLGLAALLALGLSLALARVRTGQAPASSGSRSGQAPSNRSAA